MATLRQRVAIVLDGRGQETDEGEFLVIGKVKRHNRVIWEARGG
jgi:hypothetical protein